MLSVPFEVFGSTQKRWHAVAADEVACVTGPAFCVEPGHHLNLMQAANSLSSSQPNWSNRPPSMKDLAPGRALVAWQQPVLPSDSVVSATNIWPGLRADVEPNKGALAEVRAALHVPVLAFPLNSQLSPLHLAPWLWVATTFDLHEGRPVIAE